MPTVTQPVCVKTPELTGCEKKDKDLLNLLGALRSAKQRSSLILTRSLIETARIAYQNTKPDQLELTVY